MLEDYYEKFYIQNWESKPDGFGGLIWGWADGAEFDGVFIQDTSAEMRIAEAQGFKSSGTFATGINVPVTEGDVIRRSKDGVFFKITGTPKYAPEQAGSQFKRMNAGRTEAAS